MNRWVSFLFLVLAAGIFAALVTWLPLIWSDPHKRDSYFYFRIILDPILVLLVFCALASFLFVYRKRNKNETSVTAIWPSLMILTLTCLSLGSISHIFAWLSGNISWFQTANIIILSVLLASWLLIAAFLVFSGATEAGKLHHSRAQPFK
jgi:ABC-type Fe3+-siderophore transport system permease subunit